MDDVNIVNLGKLLVAQLPVSYLQLILGIIINDERAAEFDNNKENIYKMQNVSSLQ